MTRTLFLPTKETQNKLLLMLNKQTIANLNRREQRRIRVGMADDGPVIATDIEDDPTTESVQCPPLGPDSGTCSPSDTGIPTKPTANNPRASYIECF